ncbi:GNAT family N-acetyltransferase [Acetobacteraceae bacterium H6797]|nr:GNAT family N-acetyltransferase [Acetobacteraceae bacterium H6797]
MEQTAALRRFARFFTRRIGALGHLPGGELPLTDGRVLHDLANGGETSPGALVEALGIDYGHLSRILARFEARGWLESRPDPADTRRRRLRLTEEGQAAFRPLDAAANEAAEALLSPLTAEGRERAVSALGEVERLMGGASGEVMLRRHRPGDMGWIVSLHGTVYAQEYGWDGRFEALVARIVADFLDDHDPEREVALIAERDGQRLGSVVVVRTEEEGVAKLRLLVLDPAARGLRLGARLVAEAEDFARAAGYRAMVLWTNDCLKAARHIYAGRGWALERSEPYEGFGQQLVGEYWRKEFEPAGA